MISHLLLIFSTIIIYEFIKYIDLVSIVQSNLKIYKKILQLFKYKRVSDFRKEKLLLNYSKSLFMLSVKIFLILILILIFIITLNLLSDTYFNLIMSILGIIELSIIFIYYHFIRKKFYAKL